MMVRLWKSLSHSKTARAAVCLAAAFAACAFLLGAHWRADAFSTAVAVRAQGEGHGSQTAVAWPQGTVDVNRANADELQALAGIGPSLADAVIAEREAGGPFDYPEDLVMVRGIGVKTLARFYDQLDFSFRADVP